MTQTLTRDPDDPLFQPASDSDPATPGDPLSRLRFHYGQCLSAEDFEAEQRYFVLRRRLHNALLHGVGTVWGLAIRRQEPAGEGGPRLICDPGMAIDPLGREIWVLQPLCLDVAALETGFWQQLRRPDGTEGNAEGSTAASDIRRAYVVLRYEACLSDAVPVIPVACGDDHEGLAPSRLRDSFRLCLEAEMPPDPDATVRDITRRPGPGTPLPKPRRFDRWRAPDGTVWVYDQPRNPDGTYRSDDTSTPERESQLTWMPEAGGAGTTAPPAAQAWQGWRQLLLDHALNEPIAGIPAVPGPLERFWSGADDAALLLATVDLEANGPPIENLQPVTLEHSGPQGSNPDNRVRAVLPAVQALADLALGVRLEGAVVSSQLFQALGVSARAVDAAGQPTPPGSLATATLIEVRLSRPVAGSPGDLARGVRLLRRQAGSGRWQTVRPDQVTASSLRGNHTVQLLVSPAWTTPTTFQLVLSGTGPTALLSQDPAPRPLAGVAGEGVPPGSGRDAHLFATYTPTP
jgi:hypothetical protein